jgi:two-component system response regulator YesN
MQKINVLIADDEPFIREEIVRCLERGGFCEEITECSDGSEVEPILRQKDIDLLITDNSMGLMNGLELLEIVRTHFPSLKTIMISGDDVEQQARTSGAEFLLKPTGLRKLQKTILEMFASKTAQ